MERGPGLMERQSRSATALFLRAEAGAVKASGISRASWNWYQAALRLASSTVHSIMVSASMANSHTTFPVASYP
jgi:hypothetical protein